MTDCPEGELRDLLPDLVHERLPASRRAVLVAHLEGCEDCRVELELLRALRGAMREAPAVDVNAVVAALPVPRPPRVARSSARAGWRAAAAALLIVGGGATVALLRDEPAPSPPALTAAAKTNEPLGATPRELAVSGGTVTDLTDSELSSLLRDIESLDGLPSGDVEGSGAELPPVGTEGL